jgi:GntR family transcriptional regulator
MWIRIDSHSGVAIYRQIAAQIEQAVLAGVLESGDKLPGVRELAVELAVNPATVVKAYDELEQTGVIEQPRGRGTFILGRPKLEERERRERLQAAAARFLGEAERLGFTASEALRELQRAVAGLGDAPKADGEGEDHDGR